MKLEDDDYQCLVEGIIKDEVDLKSENTPKKNISPDDVSKTRLASLLNQK